MLISKGANRAVLSFLGGLFALAGSLRAERLDAPLEAVSLPVEFEQALWAAVESGAAQSLSTEQEQGDPAMRGVWRGDTSKVRPSVRGLALRFESQVFHGSDASAASDGASKDGGLGALEPQGKVGAAGESPGASSAVHLFLDFEGELTTLRISRSGLKSTVGGVSLASGQRLSIPFVMGRGRDWQLVAFSAPLVENSDRALVLCMQPVEVPSDGLSTEKNRYQPVELSIDVSAVVDAEVTTGVGRGWARAAFRTGGVVPPPTESFDEVFLRNPTISINYSPHAEQKKVRLDRTGLVHGAIASVLDTQNSAGYRRILTNTERFWIVPFELSAHHAELLSRGMTVNPGLCQLLFKVRYTNTVYSQEEVVPPPTLRAGAERSERQRENTLNPGS